MLDNAASRTLLVLLRLSMAWVFLYAASHQVFADWSVTGFLGSTKTFHWLFAPLTAPGLAVVLTFLVGYGHLLIGLSLLSGLLVRVSAIFGIVLMVFYWMAHMDFPYISATTNFLLDEHIVYALVLGLLIAQRAGHTFGLDQWAARPPAVRFSRRCMGAPHPGPLPGGTRGRWGRGGTQTGRPVAARPLHHPADGPPPPPCRGG